MAPFRGRGGSRGGARGRGRYRGGRAGGRGGRGAAQNAGKLARSGIKTKNGYRKFDSQRVQDVDSEDDQPQTVAEPESDVEDVDDDDEEVEIKPTVKAYNSLLQSLHKPDVVENGGERSAKRRKIEVVADEDEHSDSEEDSEEDGMPQDMSGDEAAEDSEDEEEMLAEDEDDNIESSDPYEVHFASPDDNELKQKLEAIQSNNLRAEKRAIGKKLQCTFHHPRDSESGAVRKAVTSVTDLPLKERLSRHAGKHLSIESDLEQIVATQMFNYTDVLLGNRTPRNAGSLRSMAAYHAVNHVLKGRDRIIKNNERLARAEDAEVLEFRDQGFVRPKVLIMTGTRQMAANYANAIVDAFQPDQQENRKRFDDSFAGPLDDREHIPEDFRELFGGNDSDDFMTGLKFTRKTLKFYSAFYGSDIILASPLGIRKIIENEDKRKRDHDFLTSIEVVIVDQADAMQMQNWENVEIVFNHLNLELNESHGCDFSRVRNWYLDGNAKYLRQAIVMSAYITPEMNRLYNTHMQNIAGKVKIAPTYSGAITTTTGLGIKQTFSRFDSPSPPGDPDARFKYFTTAILPRLLKMPKPADGAPGILVFVPTYFDFLRLRNYFATSTQTENISFGTIHDYSEKSEQRRAQAHFRNGRHSILLYTQRAHHFYRIRMKGVKRVVMYGLPDNPIFYQEVVEGYLSATINEGGIDPVETSVRNIFSKWDGLRLERIVGTERVKTMLTGQGDTFDFV
ncbi:Putative U3 small nucleolar RNA-associated protein [Septoria linicola]|uniref:U3 small nucleolar RNA-associated protein 25 n=1 Tax=Septoria linicola TaxID=215465 RepID=A0A9Q9AZK6_9PEZI|nr:Putative U3 small nucleolar RNA-associated protein [Septoria linicola]